MEAFLYISGLFAKIFAYLLHSCHLIDAEGAAAVAVAAANTVLGLELEALVVDPGHIVAGLGQVVIFVDEGNVKAYGAGAQWLQ